MQNTRNLNEDICFECLKAGKLQCCEICPKSFHEACGPLSLVDFWKCKYCIRKQNCEFCKLKASNDALWCTICYRFSHKACIVEYQEISEQVQHSAPLKQLTYVCKSCLFRYGIRRIVQTRRSYKLINLIIEESLICLAQINFRSPLHFSFFREQDVRQAWAMAQKNKAKNRYRLSFKQQFQLPEQFCIKWGPERILQIKIPLKYSTHSKQSIYSILKDTERYLKDESHFYFFIKWNMEHEYCSWQSQWTIKMIDPTMTLIQFYFNGHKREESEDINKNLGDILREKGIIWNGMVNYNHIIRMAKYNCIYPVQIIDCYTQPLTKSITYISYYLNHIYLVQKHTQISLLLIQTQNLQLWNTSLQQNCQLLSILPFFGSEKTIHTIKQRQFKHQKQFFQVLISSLQNFTKNLHFFCQKIKSVLYIIIDNNGSFAKETRTVLNQLSKHLIFLNSQQKYDKNLDDFSSNVSSIFSHQYTFKHDIMWTKIDINPPQAKIFTSITSQRSRYFNFYNLSEQKRMVILRFMIKFGLPVTNWMQLYACLQKFDCSIFRHQFLNDDQQNTFKGYMNSLMILMSISNQIQISQNLRKYYFFTIQPKLILHRIVNIKKLTNFIRYGSKIERNQCLVKDNNMRVIGAFNSWREQDDIILVNLILELGYDSWKQIEQSKNWKQFSNRQQQLRNNRLSYISYVKIKCMSELKSPLANVSFFIKQRLNMILNNLNN